MIFRVLSNLSYYMIMYQLNDLPSLVVDLKEEMERLRSSSECGRKTDRWCQSLMALRFGQTPEAPHEAHHPLLPCLGNKRRPAGRQYSSYSEFPSSPNKNDDEVGTGSNGKRSLIGDAGSPAQLFPYLPSCPSRTGTVLCRDSRTVVGMMVLPTWKCHQSLARLP